MVNYYPVYLDLRGKKCLVVGGGAVAYRKVESLLECAAAVWVVSPCLGPSLQCLVDEERVVYLARTYGAEVLEGACLAIAATGDPEINAAISRDCRQRRIPVNVVDAPELCDFIVPAVVRRGPLCLSVSTGGSSPLLARRLRERLEEAYGPEYERFLTLLAEVRRRVLREVPEEERRRRIFAALVDSDLLELIRRGQDDLVKERIETCISLS